MRVFSCSLLIATIFAISSHDSWAEDFCRRPEVGIKTIKFSKGVVVISVARAEVHDSNFESIKFASDQAELAAKGSLSKHLRNSRLLGVRKIFECNAGKFVYVGVINAEASEASAMGINEILSSSIKSNPTPQ